MITVNSSGKIYNLTLDNFVILPNKWLCYWHKRLGVSCWAPLLLTWVTWVGFRAKVLPGQECFASPPPSSNKIFLRYVQKEAETI